MGAIMPLNMLKVSNLEVVGMWYKFGLPSFLSSRGCTMVCPKQENALSFVVILILRYHIFGKEISVHVSRQV